MSIYIYLRVSNTVHSLDKYELQKRETKKTLKIDERKRKDQTRVDSVDLRRLFLFLLVVLGTGLLSA